MGGNNAPTPILDRIKEIWRSKICHVIFNKHDTQLHQHCKLKTGKLIQLKAITGKRVAYRGCNLKKRGYD